MHRVTVVSLNLKTISISEIGFLLDATERHIEDILSGKVRPTSRELAILRICANVRNSRLRSILDNMSEEREWKLIPGYSRYEASKYGHIRRSAAGHGSMPGHVLKPKKRKEGHLYVNVSSDDGRIHSMGVHVLVCLAFHGAAPSPSHMVCHRDDVKSDNSEGNLYWGTALDNARDRLKNSFRTKSGTPVTHGAFSYGPPTLRQLRDYTRRSMAYRMKLRAEKEANKAPLVGEECPAAGYT